MSETIIQAYNALRIKLREGEMQKSARSSATTPSDWKLPHQILVHPSLIQNLCGLQHLSSGFTSRTERVILYLCATTQVFGFIQNYNAKTLSDTSNNLVYSHLVKALSQYIKKNCNGHGMVGAVIK